MQQVPTESGADRGVDSPALSHHGQMSATDAPARPNEGSAARASETSLPNAVCPIGCSGITTRTSLIDQITLGENRCNTPSIYENSFKFIIDEDGFSFCQQV